MKKVVLCCFLILNIILFSSCSIGNTNNQIGNNDWSYNLPNDYVIWHVNSRRIICGKQNSSNSISTVVDKYVLEFSYNKQYVCLKCVDFPDEITTEIDTSNPDYYIVNTLNNDIFGRFTEDEYLLNLKEYSIIDLSEWIPTKPRPNGASFS